MSGNGNYPKEGVGDGDRNNVSEYKVFVDEFGIPVEVEDPGLLVGSFVRMFDNGENYILSENDTCVDESDGAAEVDDPVLPVVARKFTNYTLVGPTIVKKSHKDSEEKAVKPEKICDPTMIKKSHKGSEEKAVKNDTLVGLTTVEKSHKDSREKAVENDTLVCPTTVKKSHKDSEEKFVKNETSFDPTTLEKACEGIGAKAVTASDWDLMFVLLQQFQKRENDSFVPESHAEGVQKLRTWLQTQRELVKKGKLLRERQQKLEEVGVIWDCLEDQLNSMFGSRRRYHTRSSNKRKINSTISYSEHVEEGVKLSQRSDAQRKIKKKRKLGNDKNQKLGKKSVDCNTLEAKWNRMFELMKRFNKREGHSNIPIVHVEEGRHLGHWIHKQREVMKKGKLPRERQQKLEEMCVVWDVYEENWNARFELLKKYHKREGNSNVLVSHEEEGQPLGVWLDRQRKLLRTGKLREDRVQKLQKMGAIWNVNEEKWNTMYGLLRSYYEREGDTNVFCDHVEGGKNLGEWFTWQRNQMKKGRLPHNRLKKMEDIGVIWDRFQTQWNMMFELLERFNKREGHPDVPYDHVEDGKHLGHWFCKQRSLLRNNDLSNERRTKLVGIGVE